MEVGKIGLVKFGGKEVTTLLPLTPSGSSSSAGNAISASGGSFVTDLIQKLDFREEHRDSHNFALDRVVAEVSNMFEESARKSAGGGGGSQGGGDIKQLMLIVTDGRMNKESVRKRVQQCLTKRILPVLIILDSANKIWDMKQASYGQVWDPIKKRNSMKMQLTPFLGQDFPFPYYAVVQSAEKLPQLFCDLLRQWLAAGV